MLPDDRNAYGSPSQPGRVDFRGLAVFLLLTFGLTWTADFSMIARGVPIWAFLAVAATMWLPAISAYVVRRWMTHVGFRDAGLRFGPWKPYLVVLVAVPLVTALIYLFSWRVGTARPDWSLSTYLAPLQSARVPKFLRSPTMFLSFLFVATVSFAPVLNLFATFGEEFGWTGYLLPKLLPLGKWSATIIYGLIWGLWHAPVIAKGYNYPGHPLAGVAMMCLFTIAFALIQASLRIRYGSVLLTSWLHACVNAQGRGVFPLVFSVANPLYEGFMGIIGVIAVGLIGVLLLARTPRSETCV
jgi:membrane protease YdiL (CAAX protease family)